MLTACAGMPEYQSHPLEENCDSREANQAPSGPCAGLDAVDGNLLQVAAMAGPPVPARVAARGQSVFRSRSTERFPGQYQCCLSQHVVNESVVLRSCVQ